MTLVTSSAEPLMLVRYSDTLVLVDDALGVEANRLRSVLQHFEATCREPGFRMQVSHVADQLVQYVSWARGIDLWVRDIGIGFQLADRGGLYDPVLAASAILLTPQMFGQSLELTKAETDEINKWIATSAGLYDDYRELEHAFAARFPVAAKVIGIPFTLRSVFDRVQVGRDLYITTKDSYKLWRTLKVVEGTAYEGQKIFRGGSEVRELAGWSQSLTHMNVPDGLNALQALQVSGSRQLILQSAKTEFIQSVWPATKWGKAFVVAGVMVNGVENWQQYYEQDGVTKVVCGTVVDSGLEIACGAVGTGLGAVGGGAIGMALGGPLGAAIGAKVGGFAGGLFGSWCADRLDEAGVDDVLTDALDTGIDDSGKMLADMSKQTGEVLADTSAAVGGSLSATASQVENAMAPAIQSIVGLF